MQLGEQNTDMQLVIEVQGGNKRAFDTLVLKYQTRVTKLVGRLVWDPVEVLDVTQEAFIRAYRALAHFRGDSAFYTWLYRIAVNTAKNYIVAQSRRPPDTDIRVEDAEILETRSGLREYGTPERMLIRDELQAMVFGTIQKLPEELKMAILLREIEGMSYEEIAEIMDCPVGTVRSRIFRAREAVDKEIKPMLEQ